ncbi:putative ABC transport system ATP-binding protein [Neisseria sp. HSC-16F19]|nr:ATP-binding cassette domain-containing protein [Neisseria sp. HSC-16F19]MCP2040186.1 putative ABC transport system ATP-binding protein [Neisseria sp. HSC-16F19]
MSTPLIHTQALSRSAAGRTLLHPVDLSIRGGERIGVHGTSGSGKSVLLRTLALLDWPDGGRLFWQGRAVETAADIQAYRVQAAYVRQQPVLMPGSVADNLYLPYTLAAYAARRPDSERTAALLHAIGRDKRFLQADSGHLSGGEAQLVCLMRIIQLEPQVLFLDEPTSALDPETAAAAEALISHWHDAAPQQRAWVWISHSPEQLSRISAQVWRVHQGQVEVETGHV